MRDVIALLVILVTCLFLSAGLWIYQDSRLNAMDAIAVAQQALGDTSAEKYTDRALSIMKLDIDARAIFIQAGLAAGVVAGLYFTYRNIGIAQANLGVAQENLTISTKTLLTAQKGQVTERFTRAVDQIGAMAGDGLNLEVRLGGIYALEGVSRDSDEYRETGAAVLSAYIRQNAIGKDRTDVQRPRVDIDAALDALYRLRTQFPGQFTVDLRFTDFAKHDLVGRRLTGFDLSGANLDGANLFEADLSQVRLQGASLQGTHLIKCLMSDANLTSASLQNADFRDANLSGASLEGATATGASLRGANLGGANLASSNFIGADLGKANLEAANLWMATFEDAKLVGAILTNANVSDAEFVRANLCLATLTGVVPKSTLFTGADLFNAIDVHPEISRAAQPAPPCS